MTMEILNPEVCDDCMTQRTSDGEWVMDVYKCPDQQEFCLNCCGCDEHETMFTELWYEPAPNPTQTN